MPREKEVQHRLSEESQILIPVSGDGGKRKCDTEGLTLSAPILLLILVSGEGLIMTTAKSQYLLLHIWGTYTWFDS